MLTIDVPMPMGNLFHVHKQEVDSSLHAADDDADWRLLSARIEALSVAHGIGTGPAELGRAEAAEVSHLWQTMEGRAEVKFDGAAGAGLFAVSKVAVPRGGRRKLPFGGVVVQSSAASLDVHSQMWVSQKEADLGHVFSFVGPAAFANAACAGCANCDYSLVGRRADGVKTVHLLATKPIEEGEELAVAYPLAVAGDCVVCGDELPSCFVGQGRHPPHSIDGMWFAYARDGRGHRDGDGVYVLHVPAMDFAEYIPIVAGKVRVANVNGGTDEYFDLDLCSDDLQLDFITFEINVNPKAAGGRCITVTELLLSA
jgi:hypothetical protein